MKKKKVFGKGKKVDACNLLQGTSKAAKETTDLAEDYCVLTRFPGECWTRYHLEIGRKMVSADTPKQVHSVFIFKAL